jgi:hypothetical protein
VMSQAKFLGSRGGTTISLNKDLLCSPRNIRAVRKR